MRTGRARALRPLAMAIVAERKAFIDAFRARHRLGGHLVRASPATQRRAMLRTSSLYGPRVVVPAVRQYRRESTWRPWWLS